MVNEQGQQPMITAIKTSWPYVRFIIEGHKLKDEEKDIRCHYLKRPSMPFEQT